MRKRKKLKKRVSKRSGKNTSEEVRQTLTKIIELTDMFCEKYLNEDYRQLCEEMAIEIYEAGVPINTGRPASWASGIVHALGWVNFLQDPAQPPHMSSTQLVEGLGVSQGTMLAKSKIIRDELDLIQLDPDWCTPAMLRDNPLVWMLGVNGFIMDIRLAPRQVQQEAYRLGLIPFIPADEQESELESGTGPKIIKFPAGQNETSRARSLRRQQDDGPDLFEELQE